MPWPTTTTTKKTPGGRWRSCAIRSSAPTSRSSPGAVRNDRSSSSSPRAPGLTRRRDSRSPSPPRPSAAGCGVTARAGSPASRTSSVRSAAGPRSSPRRSISPPSSSARCRSARLTASSTSSRRPTSSSAATSVARRCIARSVPSVSRSPRPASPTTRTSTASRLTRQMISGRAICSPAPGCLTPRDRASRAAPGSTPSSMTTAGFCSTAASAFAASCPPLSWSSVERSSAGAPRGGSTTILFRGTES